MTELRHAESVVVRGASPEQLYDMVADVTRTGEWSPICTGCWWDEGDGPAVGARFTGRNEIPGRVWETRCEVVVADRGREFAYVVGDSFVRWGFQLEPVDDGTLLTESWAFLPAGIAMFGTRFGDDAQAQIDDRTQAALTGIPATLAAIRAAAEAG